MFTRPVIFSVSLLVGLLFPLAAVPADEGKKYLCIADKAIAFFWNESSEEWYGRQGRGDSKYILKPNEDNESRPSPYAVFRFGDRHPEIPYHVCDETVSDVLDRDTIPAYQTLRCGDGLGEFRFNPNTMRFQVYYAFGYVAGRDNNDDNPYITIGECSPL